MPRGAAGGVVAEASVALVGGLTGDSEYGGDLGPGRAPVQGAGNEPLEFSLGGEDDSDLIGGVVQGVGLAAFSSIHTCQASLTKTSLSGHPDKPGRRGEALIGVAHAGQARGPRLG